MGATSEHKRRKRANRDGEPLDQLHIPTSLATRGDPIDLTPKTCIHRQTGDTAGTIGGWAVGRQAGRATYRT